MENVSIDIEKGKFFGLVGESGSGKTTLGRALLLANPITEGDVTYSDGQVSYDLRNITAQQRRDYYSRAQLIFQDPYAALSPRMTVRDIIAEPLEVMKLTGSRAETDERVREFAAKCRLNLEHLRRFPHAFSGGQRQRISIARALVSRPRFVVADECVAALDVSIQADVLNLLKSIQSELGLTFLFISHDLSVVAHICDHVALIVFRAAGRDRSDAAPFCEPETPLYQGPAVGHTLARPGRARHKAEARGRDSVTGESAARLQVPDPLPVCGRSTAGKRNRRWKSSRENTLSPATGGGNSRPLPCPAPRLPPDGNVFQIARAQFQTEFRPDPAPGRFRIRIIRIAAGRQRKTSASCHSLGRVHCRGRGSEWPMRILWELERPIPGWLYQAEEVVAG